MVSCSVTTKPKGIMLAVAYATAIPIWLLSAPFIVIGNVSAWTSRRKQQH